MISELNRAWNWKGIEVTEVIRENDFGNVVLKTKENNFWRICPEELNCERIAKNEMELNKLFSEPEFLLDWQMTDLVTDAKAELGELEVDEKYCLKIPAVLGGGYEKTNLGKITFSELISSSGDLAFQIKDLRDGDHFKLKIKN